MVAEKYSVLIKYKYLEYFENAKLSDADSWVLMKGIIEYDRDGKIPVFENPILTALFAIIKTDLDSNKEKWKETVKAKSEAGKKGMEKRWGNKKEDIAIITPVTHDNTDNSSYNQITGITKITDLGNGGDLDHEFVNGGGCGNEIKGDQKSETAKPPPPIEQIKKESKAQGFFIDAAIARQFQDSGLDPSWLLAPFSFLEFSAEKVRKKYPDKDPDALKPIFIAAVKSWEDIREAYPEWREKQKMVKQKAECEKSVSKVRDNPPRKCQCGGELNSRLLCQTCGGYYSFEKEKLEYTFFPKQDISISERMNKLHNKRKG
jgi:hypothetical protein